MNGEEHTMNTTTTETPTVEDAVRAIAARCDGARARDGVGFNGHDTKFGKRLALIPSELWNEAMRAEAHRMLVLYREQLAECGIDYDELPVPDANARANSQYGARDDARKLARRIEAGETLTAPSARGGAVTSLRTVRLGGGKLVIAFEYDRALVDSVKTLPGRRFDNTSKTWQTPKNVAAAVVQWADEHGFDVAADVRALAAEQPAPEPVDRRVLKLVDGRLHLHSPYDAGLVAAVRAVPMREWNSELRINEFPVDAAVVAPLRQLVKQHSIDVEPEAAEALRAVAARAETMQSASRQAGAVEIDVELPAGLSLMPFQSSGVQYALEARRTFIADEMGLGKTVQAIVTMLAADAFPALIVVPASLRLNWIAELRKWAPAKRLGVALSQSTRKSLRQRLARQGVALFTSAASLDPSQLPLGDQLGVDVLVVNYDVLGDYADVLAGTQFKAVVFDESHFIKTPKAKRTQAAQRIVENTVDDALVLMLSGTPVLNRPKELITQLRVLGRLEELGGYKHFTRRYCGAHFDGQRWNDTGASNLEELNDRMRAACFVRRLKTDVLTELPDKRRVQMPVDGDPQIMREYEEADRNIVKYMSERAAEIAEQLGEDATEAKIEAGIRANAAEHLVQIMQLKRIAARAKLPAAFEWIDEFVAGGNKLVVFAHHKDVVNAIAERYGGLRIAGDDDAERRNAAVERFQNDPTVRVLACSIRAAGVGITLTAASDVLFIEQDWTPAAHDQAEDRCHRIGQSESVTAWYMLLPDSIDEDIAELITEKRAIVDAAHDGRGVSAAGKTSVAGDVLVKFTRRARGTAEK